VILAADALSSVFRREILKGVLDHLAVLAFHELLVGLTPPQQAPIVVRKHGVRSTAIGIDAAFHLPDAVIV
jgi:hypothetical protein